MFHHRHQQQHGLADPITLLPFSFYSIGNVIDNSNTSAIFVNTPPSPRRKKDSVVSPTFAPPAPKPAGSCPFLSLLPLPKSMYPSVLESLACLETHPHSTRLFLRSSLSLHSYSYLHYPIKKKTEDVQHAPSLSTTTCSS